MSLFMGVLSRRYGSGYGRQSSRAASVSLRFEWDQAKADSNFRKHRVSFETATLVFDDPFVMTEQDRIENGEYRWQSTGQIAGALLLVVAHVYRDDGDAEVIRIISARRAEKRERRRYEQARSI
jgi:uncharacterized DUF497 family protein